MILKVIPFGIDNAKQEIVDVRRIDTVALLRQLISEKYGKDKCPVERLRLIYMGKVLEDLKANGTEAILYNTYGIRDNMTVNISLKSVFPSTPSELSESVAVGTSADASIDNVDASIANADASTNIPPPEACVSVTSPDEPKANPEPQPEVAAVIPPEDEEEYVCPQCNNNPRVKKCKECGCQKCFLKNGDPLVCDQCQMYWHMECAQLEKMPEENYWYCPDCRNEDIDKVIAEGQGIDQDSSKKKAKMPSTTQTKHWGGGMACVGLEKTCIIVNKSHFGPIPGIHVGQSWKFRITCSEWGVHRPPVAGIAGGECTGCPSIVLAAGYPEDKDDGDEFTYTGSGGRDLKTGNKRVASQTTDQQLDRSNLALAMTCYTKLSKNGGNAGDNWRKSSPIRVVRSDKLAKHHPKYAPAEGQRYDGIYKLVKYYKEKGRSGHIVWRFLMRRDDPDPAPWTVEGKRRIEEFGLRMIYPRKEMVEAGVEAEDKEGKGKGKGKTKTEVRKMETAKIKRYEVPEDVERMMKEDTRDMRIWQDVLAQEFWSEYEFLHHVFNDAFICCVCSDRITNPVTTPCGHVACQHCLQQASKENARCPWCRSDLKESVTGKASYAVNKDLLAVLKRINWAYAGGNLPVQYGGGSTAPGGASWGHEAKDDKKSKGQKVDKGKAGLKIAKKRKAVVMEGEDEEEGEVEEIKVKVAKETRLCDPDADDFVEMPKKEKVGSAAKKAKVAIETATSQFSSLGVLTMVEVVIECRQKHSHK